MGIEPMTSSLPRMRSTTELRRRLSRAPQKSWSGRRDSNPQHLAWKASALPLRYARPVCDAPGCWARPASVPTIAFKFWCWGKDSNLRRA
jgi:hypothetical protein